MKADLQYFFNDCSTCLQSQEKNKKQERIPAEEVHYPFQQLTMDIGKTPAREHILAITDRYTGYVWAAKTGDTGTGTTSKCIDILKSCIGTGLLAENGIRRIKRAIGNEKFSDAWDNIQALNQSSPYSNEIQSPFEAMYGFQTAVFGLPQPQYLKKMKENQLRSTARRNHKAEKMWNPMDAIEKTKTTLTDIAKP